MHENDNKYRAQRNMRWVFWVCTAILFVGTHYPKLVIGTPEDSPDKLVHFFVFGGWGLLLWAARYVRTPLLIVIAVATFGLVDEWTQAIPVIGRTFDLGDLVADVAGGIVVAAGMLAMRPTGIDTAVVRAREESLVAAGWRLLSRPLNLAHLVVGGALGAVFGCIVLVVVVAGNSAVGPMTSGVLGFFLGGYAGLAAAFCIGHRRMALADDAAAARLASEWRLATVRIALQWVIVVGLVVGTVWWIASRFFGDWSIVDWALNHRERLGVNLSMAIEVAIAGVLLAFVARRTRVGVARRTQ